MSQTGPGLSGQPKAGGDNYRLLFDRNPQPMWIWDVESSRFLAANEAAISHFGYSPDEFLAVNIEGIHPATEAQSLSKFLSESLTSVPQTVACKFQKKDGTSIDVEIHSQPINWLCKPAQIIVMNDITGREQAEHDLRDSEERVRLILSSAAEAIFGCDPVGTCIFCNDAAAHLLGFENSSELLGMNMHATEHHTRADGTPYPLEECPIYLGFQAGHGIHRDDEIFWRKNGTSFPVEYWSHLTIQDGKPLCVVAFNDITDQRQAAEALRKSEERWRAVYENSAIGVALTDLNGRFLAVNRAYEKMLGYTEEELRKLTFLEITEEDYRGFNWDLVNELLEGKRQQFQIEKQYRRKDGTLRWVSNNVSLVPGTESMPRFIMALSEDITERRQAEEALRRSAERKRTLLEINNAIITILTRDALFQSVSEALSHLINFDRSALTLYDPLTDSLRFVAFTGNPLRFRIGDELKRTESSVGWVFDHQRPIVRGDLEKEQQYLNERHLIDEGMRSHCIVPLIVRGKSIGTLDIAIKTRGQYSELDAEFLQEVANQISLAIENMKSYEEISELKARLEKENVYLKEEIHTEHNFEEIVGNSPALLAALRKVEQVAPTDATVLIYGETGTGKELVARAIHNSSARKDRPLVKVNCSAISAGLVESELFGHVKGAFTGAIDRRIGRFELADGGTIFLDEIGELPLETQVKLLRVLQEREFEPLGSSRPLRVDVRVIAATNRDLEEATQSGRFRSDLFYRLNVFPIEVPPLRDRRADISKLTKFFLSNYSKRLGKNIEGISQATMNWILDYSWPGNIRELQNVIERAVVLSQGRMLELQGDLAHPVLGTGRGMADQAPDVAQAVSLPASQLATLEEVERNHIVAALKVTAGVIEGPKGAAKILNLHPNTLRHRMEKFGIKRSAHDPS